MSTRPFDLPPTGNLLVDQALERLSTLTDNRFHYLEDAMLVQAQLESRMAKVVKQQAEWQAETAEAVQCHEKWLRDTEIKKSEMDEKINFLIDRDMRREGGPESNSYS